jgi:transposase
MAWHHVGHDIACQSRSTDCGRTARTGTQQAAVITRNDRELNWRQAKIDKLTHEVAYYKRHYFGVKAERLPVEQGQLFEETLAADMAAMTEELAQLSETKPKGQAKRKPLPPELPRTEIHHEPESTTCACGCQMKRIGEDVAEKLDYTPGTFTVERHIRGKWACAECETWCRRRFRRM